MHEWIYFVIDTYNQLDIIKIKKNYHILVTHIIFYNI